MLHGLGMSLWYVRVIVVCPSGVIIEGRGDKPCGQLRLFAYGDGAFCHAYNAISDEGGKALARGC